MGQPTVDWMYTVNFIVTGLVTYMSLMAVYGIVLAAYHFCVFLPKMRRHLYREEEIFEPDTKSKLVKIAKKHNQLDKTQDEEDEEDRRADEKTLEKTQSHEEIMTAKQMKSKEDTGKRPSRRERNRSNKKDIVSADNKTAKSNTSTVVSRRGEKELLLLQTTQSDLD